MMRSRERARFVRKVRETTTTTRERDRQTRANERANARTDAGANEYIDVVCRNI